MNGNTFGFGSSASTASPAGTLFGAQPTNNNTAGASFGANTTNSSAAGTLFGGSAAAAGSQGFGGFNKPSTTSAFGAPATSQPSAGFGSVGGFGSATSSASTPSLGGFGSTATSTPATSTSGFGFGASAPGFGTSTAAPTTGFGAPVTSTPFGATATSTPFGATANSTPFGAPATSSAPGFGQASGGGGFGFGSGAGSNLFSNKSATTNTLPGITTQPFGAQPLNNNQQQQQQQGAVPVQEKVWQELALIRAHFDPTSPLCQFRHYFYNMVPANETHFYVRPQNQDEQLWNEAARKNPDPTCMVPVLAIGFDDILKRMEIQSKQVDLHQEKLKEASARLTTVQRQYSLATLVRLEEHKRRHTDLTQRLLRLLRYSQVLRYKGFPLNADEEQAMNQLAQLATQNDNPENLYAKLRTLWNQLEHIKSQRMMDQRSKAEVWRTVREEDTEKLTKALEDEQKGITHVASILKADTKELEAIESNLQGRKKN